MAGGGSPRTSTKISCLYADEGKMILQIVDRVFFLLAVRQLRRRPVAVRFMTEIKVVRR